MIFRQILETKEEFDPNKMDARCFISKINWCQIDQIEIIASFVTRHVRQLTDVDVRQFFPLSSESESRTFKYSQLVLDGNSEILDAIYNHNENYDYLIIQSMSDMVEQAIEILSEHRLVEMTALNNFRYDKRSLSLLREADRYDELKEVHLNRVRDAKQALDDFGRYMNKITSTEFSKDSIIRAIGKATVSVLNQGLQFP